MSKYKPFTVSGITNPDGNDILEGDRFAFLNINNGIVKGTLIDADHGGFTICTEPGNEEIVYAYDNIKQLIEIR